MLLFITSWRKKFGSRSLFLPILIVSILYGIAFGLFDVPGRYFQLLVLLFLFLVIINSVSFLSLRTILNIRLIGVTVFTFLSIITILTGNSLLTENIESSFPVTLFFGNPNTLASCLVMLAVSLIAFSPLRLSFAIALLLGIAVVFTGSRLAFLCTSLIITFLITRCTLRYHFWGLVGILLLIIASITTYVVSRGKVEGVRAMQASSNLLTETDDFSNEWWTVYRYSEVNVQQGIVPGPFPNTRGHAISLKSVYPHKLTFFHRVKRATSQENYVASLYVRSNSPTEFVLSNNLSTTICQVLPEWSRCITPAAKGDDYHSLQFQMQTLENNQEVEFYFWGPQIEIGDKVTEYSPKRPMSKIEAILLRFDIQGRLQSRNELFDRFDIWIESYGLFIQNPLWGLGRQAFLDVDYNHAHNFFLNILVKYGLIGLGGILVVWLPLLIPWRKYLKIDFVPILACTTLLNVFDDNFFFWINCLSFAFVIGLAYSSKIDDLLHENHL